MIDAATRLQAQRVFEETLTTLSYVLVEPAILACTLPDTDGTPVIVAQYMVYPDGTFRHIEATEEA